MVFGRSGRFGARIAVWAAPRGLPAARQLGGVRGKAARGVDVSRIPRRERPASREDWKEEVDQSVRPGIECAFSAFKRLFGGHVAARKWENVVKEVARKIAIYSAIPGAAGGA